MKWAQGISPLRLLLDPVVVRFDTESGFGLLLPVLINAAAIVQFDGVLISDLMLQGRFVVTAAVRVIDLLTAQPFVLGGVVGNASVGVLNSGHGRSLEGMVVVPIADRSRFVGRSVASPREWLLPAGKATHDRHLSSTFCPSMQLYRKSVVHSEHFADLLGRKSVNAWRWWAWASPVGI